MPTPYTHKYYYPQATYWSYGEGVPSQASGINNEIYFDTSTGDLYTKLNSAWSKFYTNSGGGGGGISSVGAIDSAAKSANGAVISGSTITFQTADGSYPGMLSLGSQTIIGAKTFTSDVTVPYEAYGAGWNGSNEVPTKDALYDIISTLPTSTGVTALGALDGQPKAAAGGTISGSNLYFQTADGSFPGLISTGIQTISGAKTFSSDVTVPDEVYGAGWNGSLEVPTKNAVYDKIQTLAAPGLIVIKKDDGTETTYVPASDTDLARGTSLVTAVGAMAATDTLILGPGTYQITSSLTPPANSSIVGLGNPTIYAPGLAANTVAVTLTSSGVTLDSFKVQCNTTCIGIHNVTPQTVTNLVLRNLNCTVTDSNANALMFSESEGGGNTEHLITLNAYDCIFYGGDMAGFGVFASLQTGSEINLYTCDVFGATDGLLCKNNAGTSAGVTNIYGGRYFSVLDAITSGGTNNVVNAYGAYAYGDQADLYGDDGTLNTYWCIFRPEYAVGNGLTVNNHAIVGSLIPYDVDKLVDIGSSAYKWRSLYLQSAGTINFNSGDVVLTHSSNLLTLSGGDFAVPSEVYGATWNGSNTVPTKDAIYDKVVSLENYIIAMAAAL